MMTHDWTRTLAWTPWDGFERLQRDARRLLAARAGETQPPVRVHASASKLELFVELPGRDPADIDATLSGRTLVVRGKAVEGDAPTTVAERREFGLPAFERSFELPWNVASDGMQATFAHGILRIELARVAEERPRRIAIGS
jgi:HSP20 family protein